MSMSPRLNAPLATDTQWRLPCNTVTIPVRLRTNTGPGCPGPGGWSGPGHQGHQGRQQPPGPQGVGWAYGEMGTYKVSLLYHDSVSTVCPSIFHQILSVGLHRPAAQSRNNLRQEHPALPGRWDPGVSSQIPSHLGRAKIAMLCIVFASVGAKYSRKLIIQ